MRFVTYLAGGCVLLLSSHAGAADWWSKAKEAINSDIGQQVIGTASGQASSTVSSSAAATSISGLTNSDVSQALRDALRIGSERVVNNLGTTDGFNLDDNIHIPLPGGLSRVNQALSAIGMGSLTEDLELRLNRAAEAATPKAKALFVSAIQDMTIDDAKAILTGPSDAATEYLRNAMGPQLRTDIEPIIQNALAQAGAVKAYDQVIGQYDQIPFMPDAKASLNDYVSEKALDGIFYYIAQEEAAIRSDPVKQTTNILKKVFGAQ